MTQLLKRIVISQKPNVLIEDLGPSGVFLKNKGDARDLLNQYLNGKNQIRFTLEQVCASRSLDNLIKRGHLKLYDENGNELNNAAGGEAEKSTNLATLKDIDDAKDKDGHIIQSNSVDLPQRNNLNFSEDFTITDKSILDTTNISLKYYNKPVESSTIQDPNTISPSIGESYIVETGGVGVWSGQDNNIAEYNGSTWDITIAQEGLVVYIKDKNRLEYYNGAQWGILINVSDINNFQENVEDIVANLIQNGTGLIWNYNDAGNELTANVGGLTVSEFISSNISQWTNDSGYLTNIINESFTDLSDTPNSYSGSGEYLLRVNSTPDALEFVNGFNLFAALSHTHPSSEITNFSEAVDDRVSSLIQNGTGITWTYNDSLNTLTGNVSLSPFSTTDLSEGANLYYTNARVDARVQGQNYTITGNWIFTNEVSGIDPTISSSLATKNYVDNVVNGLSWLEPVINIQEDNTLDPGVSPTTGDRYILTDVTNLNANFGTISGVEDDDIVEYDGANFVVSFDASGSTGGESVWVEDISSTYVYNGTLWVISGSTTPHNSLNSIQGGTTNEYYHLTATQHTEITTFFASTDILAAEAETLTDGSNADSLHIHTSTAITDFSEAVDDRVSSLIQNGTGLTWTYNDSLNTLTGNVSLSPFSTTDLSEGSNLYYTEERVDDRVSNLLQEGIGITLTYNDIANTLDISAETAIEESKRYSLLVG